MKKYLIKLASWYLRKQGIIYMTKGAFKIPFIIRIKGQEIKLKGLLDTGNALIDPLSKYPVIIIESNIIKNILSESDIDKHIPYQTIDALIDVIKGFQPEEIRLKNRIIKKVIVGVCKGKLSKNGSYNAILHPNLLLG